jgi:hypothetical protein
VWRHCHDLLQRLFSAARASFLPFSAPCPVTISLYFCWTRHFFSRPSTQPRTYFLTSKSRENMRARSPQTPPPPCQHVRRSVRQSTVLIVYFLSCVSCGPRALTPFAPGRRRQPRCRRSIRFIDFVASRLTDVARCNSLALISPPQQQLRPADLQPLFHRLLDIESAR